MEIIHKVISVPEDRKVMLMLPKNIPVGDVEVVVIINPKKLVETTTHSVQTTHSQAHTSVSSTSLRDAAISKLASLFDEQQAQHHQEQQDKNS